jgi:hypothetical protein
MFASLVRTLVPIVVGWLLSVGLADAGVTEGDLTPAVTALVTAVYYVGARLLEHYASPRFGWLLGKATAPTYQAPDGP